MKIVDLAQAVENEYIGSPCGKLDQIMIYFAKEGMGAHYHPKDRSITHIPLGANAEDFRIVCLDTGTVRPGLEKSTYKFRRGECEKLAALGRGRVRHFLPGRRAATRRPTGGSSTASAPLRDRFASA